MLKTLIEKFPPRMVPQKSLRNARSVADHLSISFRNYFYFRAQIFCQKNVTRKSVLEKLGPQKYRETSYPAIKHMPVKIVKHGAYQVETSVSTQLTPPNLIVHTLDADPPRSPS